jgi:multiple sugar transport system substrate-binding protein
MRLASILKIFIFSIALCFIASSCGKKENATTQKVTFWHFWSEPSQKKAVMELIGEFEKQNNCKVELTELSWSDGKIKLFAAFNSNTAPDVLDLGSDWVAQFSSIGILAELKQDQFKIDNYEPFFVAPGKWRDKLYAIPWVVNSRAVFYNKELFKKAGLPETPPATIQEMYSYAEKISSIQGVYGFGVNGSDPHRLYKKVAPFIWTYGGDFVDSLGNLTVNSPKAASALEMYNSLSRVGIIETQKKLDDMFARGELGMWISGSWLLDKIKEVNPFLNFGVAVFPGITADKPGTSFAGGEYLAINKSSKNQELASKLVKFLTNGENELKLCKAIKDAGFPADKQYYNDKYYNTLPFMPIFAEQLKHSRMTPVHPKWLDLETALEDAVVETLYAKKSVYEALNDIQTSMAPLFKPTK